MKTHIKTPCKGCPFTKKGVNLSPEKAQKIAQADAFVCHEAVYKKGERLQCAGFLLFNKDAVFHRAATALNIDLELTENPKNPVLSEQDFFKKHSL